jgi:hypothetical protein
LGQDIDAVFLLMGSLFVYCLLPNSNNGRYFSTLRFMVLSIFVIYYFSSGINKIIDLSFIEWFKYDLFNLNESMHLAYVNGGGTWLPKLNINQDLGAVFSYLGVVVTYIVHLGAPILIFSNGSRKVLVYWFFYSIFHFMTMFVGILFTMNFFAWLLVLPVHKWVNYERKE